jgi:thymidine kinase
MTNIDMEDSGYLSLFLGPMYSGKTSKLIELYKQFTFCNIPIIVINYKGDTRYSDTMLSTHDKHMIPCIMCENLSEIQINYMQEFNDAKIILINEGQFFNDIIPWVFNAINSLNKHIYISGLDGDFKRNQFANNWLSLIPHADTIIKLHSYCSICKKKPAIFSHRIYDNDNQILIGSEAYIPLCRNFYNNQNNKNT